MVQKETDFAVAQSGEKEVVHAELHQCPVCAERLYYR